MHAATNRITSATTQSEMTQSAANQSALFSLTRGLFDYAGLFPPARLSMTDVVANYIQYQTSPAACLLGRLVVACGQLSELVEVLREVPSADSATPPRPLALTVLSKDWNHDRSSVQSLVEQHASLIKLAAVEQPWNEQPPTADQLPIYVECPVSNELEERMRRLKQAGCFGKIRMGGLTAAAFPSAVEVVRFMRCCRQVDIAYKATAGLHHAFPSTRPVCSEPASPQAPMHGFVNVLLVAALLEGNLLIADDLLLDVMNTSDPAAFAFEENGIHFRGQLIAVDAIEAARSRLHAIGSCSFEEPLDDLKQAGWATLSPTAGEV